MGCGEGRRGSDEIIAFKVGWSAAHAGSCRGNTNCKQGFFVSPSGTKEEWGERWGGDGGSGGKRSVSREPTACWLQKTQKVNLVGPGFQSVSFFVVFFLSQASLIIMLVILKKKCD